MTAGTFVCVYLLKYGYIQNAQTQDWNWFSETRCVEIIAVYFLGPTYLCFGPSNTNNRFKSCATPALLLK